MADDFQKRQVAFKVHISQIINSPYFKEEGMQPNYVLVNNVKVSRANVIGVVLSKSIEETNTVYQNLVLDDGSGKIPLRVFDDKKIDVAIGDFVLVIGRPREFGTDKYIVPEIIKRIDQRWALVRKKELEPESKEKSASIPEMKRPTDMQAMDVKESKSAGETVFGAESGFDRIMNMIRETDSGNGVSFEEIIEKFDGKEDPEKLIKRLLELGELFEIRRGMLKILE